MRRIWYWLRTGRLPVHMTDPTGHCSHEPTCRSWYQHYDLM